MSKKTAIATPEKSWCVVDQKCFEDGSDSVEFTYWALRRNAREHAKDVGGTVRKVTKIVYYYE